MKQRCADGRVVFIYTPAVEDWYAENMYQWSELDWLIDHNSAAYAELVLHSPPGFRGDLCCIYYC